MNFIEKLPKSYGYNVLLVELVNFKASFYSMRCGSDIYLRCISPAWVPHINNCGKRKFSQVNYRQSYSSYKD